ncbi:transketolase [Pneumocystis carinii B80]|uniref:transketolase n=1 Tax=Pneumocystis carinii (strain B80) TaxID=1408658 RepID=A0A0W4ZHG7_PNEC8|nr:transketolase [Pneumocystis carinii B80]KTW27805.1 transketolase [Pneumocystis carinii B80]
MFLKMIIEKCVNTIRVLSVDMVSKSNSGHPGAPMALATSVHILFNNHMTFDPTDPSWINRDRFILSNGHACALQYILLHLYNYKITMDDLKQFRQLDSKTPGHPEASVTPGVEVTTGPLGQGFANAVGLSIAQTHLAAIFNKPGFDLINNYVYCFFGDGCAMEGVLYEAASLAGHLKLGNLICFYDYNGITIDGDIGCAFTENVAERFRALGWHVIFVDDGDTDFASIDEAIVEAKEVKDQPTMIRLKTTIGYGSKCQGTASVHGAPLKEDDVISIKEKFGFDPKESFVVSDDVYDYCRKVSLRGIDAHNEWLKMFSEYEKQYPKLAKEFQRRLNKQLPENFKQVFPTYKSTDPPAATRKLSETVLTKISGILPELIGGSADLTSSNLTRWPDAVDFQHPSRKIGNYRGRYIRYGVREHAMIGIMNGLAAYGAIIPFGGTFLNFVFYGAGSLRLSSISHLRIIVVATHDSIGLGEDGPTHQPIEASAWLRALPNMMFWRPADGNECSAAYYVAITSLNTPSTIALSRQNLPHLENSSLDKAIKGGYVLYEDEFADLTIASTGSEVFLCVDAIKILKEKYNIRARLVSIPCFYVFDQQDFDYRLSVLKDHIPVLGVEVYTTFGWRNYSHEQFGLDTFGASASYKDIYSKHEFTPEGIACRAKKTVEFWKHVENIRSPIRCAF